MSTDPQPSVSAERMPSEVAALRTKARRMLADQQACPHVFGFLEMGGQIQRVRLVRGEGFYVSELGAGFDPDRIVRESPRFSYKCNLCGLMLTDNQYRNLPEICHRIL
jgi:hypothetical protein